MYSNNDTAPSSSSFYKHDPTTSVIGQQILRDISSDDTHRFFLPGPLPSVSVPPRSVRTTIAEFPGGEPYEVKKPIEVTIKENALGDFLARFEEANLAMPGETLEDSRSALAAHILDVYELLKKEPPKKLGSEAKRQLAILRKFVKEK